MARDLKILNEGEWFLGKDDCEGYPISYRYVICHSLLSYLNSVQFDKVKGLEVLQKLKERIESKRDFHEDDFIEMFPLSEDWGFVIVDQSDGIYPLVIYSQKRETDLGVVKHSERVSAFDVSLYDVIEKYDAIYDALNQHGLIDWDKDFQEKLFRSVGFEYKESE